MSIWFRNISKLANIVYKSNVSSDLSDVETDQHLRKADIINCEVKALVWGGYK